MVPTDGFPQRAHRLTWTRRRPWSSPRCAETNVIIWPWQTAWQKSIDHYWGSVLESSEYTWVSEEAYLILKLKGETDV